MVIFCEMRLEEKSKASFFGKKTAVLLAISLAPYLAQARLILHNASTASLTANRTFALHKAETENLSLFIFSIAYKSLKKLYIDEKLLHFAHLNSRMLIESGKDSKILIF